MNKSRYAGCYPTRRASDVSLTERLSSGHAGASLKSVLAAVVRVTRPDFRSSNRAADHALEYEGGPPCYIPENLPWLRAKCGPADL